MDESGFCIGTIQAARVFVDVSQHLKFQANPRHQEWVTAIECIYTDGSAIPPLIIFKGETISTEWISSTEVPDDWRFHALIEVGLAMFTD